MGFPSHKIIAFEGLGNCFKSTNFNYFSELMKEVYVYSQIVNRHYRVITEKFPRYGTQCAVGVEKWLDGSFDRNVMKQHPEAIVCQYSTDRFSYWFESVHGGERNIDKLYDEENPTVFIFDRYNISNAIYNPLIGNDTTIDDINFDINTFGIPQADVVVYFRMKNFDVLKNLIAAKKNKDANEIDTTYLKEVWERSEKAIVNKDIFDKAGINLLVIDVLDENDNIKSKEDISHEVWMSICDMFDDKEIIFGNEENKDEEN